jgi:hypothetical protein
MSKTVWLSSPPKLRELGLAPYAAELLMADWLTRKREKKFTGGQQIGFGRKGKRTIWGQCGA